MHPYLPYLLNDITSAHRQEIPTEQKQPKTFEAEMEEIEKWATGENAEHTFGYYCEMDSEIFSPPEQLTDEEMVTIRRAFEQMMYSWNHGISLPDKLPVSFAYKMIVDSLNMKTSIVNSGMMSFDFCTGYAPDCVFKEYCPCLEIWNQGIDENYLTDQSTNENPFYY